MFTATVNGERSYSIESSPEGFIIDDHIHLPDIRQNGGQLFHIIHQHASYVVELISADYQQKVFTLKLSGKEVTIQMKDELDLMVEKLGMAQAAEATITEIKAPMPGLIVGISVEQGQEVKPGDSLITLEAMKMENVIKAPVGGVVSTVHVTSGESVDKNKLLLSFA